MNSSKKMMFLVVVLLLSCETVTAEDCWMYYAAGAVVSVAAAPFVLPAIGFSAGGIVAGSYAASMMSTAATVGYGGAAVAAMQSAGAAGIGVAAKVAVGATGAYVAGRFSPCADED